MRKSIDRVSDAVTAMSAKVAALAADDRAKADGAAALSFEEHAQMNDWRSLAQAAIDRATR